MRLDSMKKRTQKSVAMGLSKLWLSWYDHEHADNGGATCADCEPSPKPQAA